MKIVKSVLHDAVYSVVTFEDGSTDMMETSLVKVESPKKTKKPAKKASKLKDADNN